MSAKRNSIRLLVRRQYVQEVRTIASQLGLVAVEAAHPTMEQAVHFEFSVTDEDMSELLSRIPAEFHARVGIFDHADMI